MVAPIQLTDPALQRAYVALGAQPKIEARDVDRLLAAARGDDGRIDARERQDLRAIADHNRDLFAPADRQRLLAGDAAGGPALALPRASRPEAPARPLAPADATRVHVALADPRNPRQNPLDPHGVARSMARARGLPEDVRPPEHTLSAADPRVFTPEHRAAAEAELARRRAQASIDAQCELDPFAAGVNGMWKGPGGSWERVGPSPLEVASQTAFVASVPGRIYSAYTAGKAVATAVEDPTPGNVGTAVLKVGLTGGGEYAKVVHSPLKPAITVSKGVYSAQGHRPHHE